MIRRATVTDVPAMGRIINDCAEFGLMLPRSLAGLYENVREFQVATAPAPGSFPGSSPGSGHAPAPASHPGRRDAAGERVIGVCGLSIIWADLAEVVALAVAPEARGQGLGRRLVEACIDEARELGIRKVMSLTYERAFFERLGFAVVDRMNLPHKVWADCVRCPKHEACDEIAMMRILDEVPPAPAPAPPVSARYDVPVVLTTSTKAGPKHSD